MNPAAFLLNPKSFKKTDGTLSSSSSSLDHSSSSPFNMSQSRASSEPHSLDSPHDSISSDNSCVFPDFDASSTASQLSLTQEGKARSSRAQSAASEAPKASTPLFDPKVLLSPRAASKRSRNALEDEDSTTQSDDTLSSGAPSGLGNFIERIHNVSRREDEPRKRIMKDIRVDGEDPTNKSTFTGTANGTVLGQYIKDKREEGKLQEPDSGPPVNLPLRPNNDVVDLTGGMWSKKMS